MSTPTRINEDGDLEKLCGRCDEWWPYDDEFWPRNSTSGNLSSPCRACCSEIRTEIAARPCNYPGCNQPRYGRASAHCREHYYQIRHGRSAPKPKRKADRVTKQGEPA